MSRGTRAIIDLAALRFNHQKVRQLAPNSKIWSVVKANGYGHGATRIAQALAASTDGFAVATLDEACELRQAGIDKPILLLEGTASAGQTGVACEENIELVIHNPEQLQWLVEQKKPARVWLKIDTGMHRLGISVAQVAEFAKQVSNQLHLTLVGIMTHLASADEPDNPQTDEQLAQFAQAQALLPNVQHCISNSAATVSLVDTHANWIRPGIILYGASPFADKTAKQLGFKPVMSLLAPVIAVRNIDVGEKVGYGGNWTAKRPTSVATLAIGYADGYPRHAPNGTPVWLNGQQVELIGRVSMDMITVDVTDLAHVELGDEAVLWGEQVSVDTVASACNTIGYELLTRRSLRVPLQFRD
ncbi:alanine racemase [Salinibius halmophilus]|uniref:alanine racemase n=1 Tax=Salinibius halmophilus TaxID=1853216 RepID=UPI000E665545|nr:alanine racemase [Salinibius halmophilus]